MCSNLGNICGNVRLDDLKDFLVWQKPSFFCSQYFLQEKKSESENIQHFPEQSSKYWNFSAVNNSFFWCLFLTGSFNPSPFLRTGSAVMSQRLLLSMVILQIRVCRAPKWSFLTGGKGFSYLLHSQQQAQTLRCLPDYKCVSHLPPSPSRKIDLRGVLHLSTQWWHWQFCNLNTQTSSVPWLGLCLLNHLRTHPASEHTQRA